MRKRTSYAVAAALRSPGKVAGAMEASKPVRSGLVAAGWPEAADDRILLEVATEAARRAAELQREARADADPYGWSEKGRSDFVTEVDLESERRILGLLRERFPDHALLAEEGTDAEEQGAEGEPAPRNGSETAAPTGDAGAPVRWIVDPLDGTTNWMHGYPEYAISIAAEDAAGLRVGVVWNSATGEVFQAVRGAGSRRDGVPIRVSGLDDPALALVGTGFPFKKLEVLPTYLDAFTRILESTSGIRRAGAAALDLCDLACGRLDAFWEYWLMPWDIAAGALIVREAGGRFEPLEVAGIEAGTEHPELRSGAFLGANQALFERFGAMVRGTNP